MNIGSYGLLIVFGAFIILLIRRPNMSCFGKKLKSPFYPVLRRKRMQREAQAVLLEKRKRIQTRDYGFKLDEPGGSGMSRPVVSPEAKSQAEDYGFKLD